MRPQSELMKLDNELAGVEKTKYHSYHDELIEKDHKVAERRGDLLNLNYGEMNVVELRSRIRIANADDLIYIYNSVIQTWDDRELANSVAIDIINRLSVLQPESAVYIVENIGPSKFRQNAIGNLLGRIPKGELLSVVQLNRLYAYPEDERSIKLTLSNRLSEFNKEELVGAISGSSEWLKRQLTSAYGRVLAAESKSYNDLDLSKFDNATKEQIVLSWASQLSTVDPESLLHDSRFKNDPCYENILPAVALNYAHKKPEVAANWAKSNFGNGHSSELAFNVVIYKWLNDDSKAASDWVANTKLSESEMDAAASQVYRYLTEKGDASSAQEWLDGINNEQIRNSIQKAYRLGD
ncbi:hypothetical protein [Luteolibacter pohnpeiensis]|uniref:hypothetical protein n=1 Tax=Luteolibacter pohnpeiensis TaxID=454153 RepID=UPI001907DC4F|nr:hypothetical protein [Luteolibacter pohnpeiensis]